MQNLYDNIYTKRLQEFERVIRTLNRSCSSREYRSKLFNNVIGFIKNNTPVNDVYICEKKGLTRRIRTGSKVIVEFSNNTLESSKQDQPLIPFYVKPLNNELVKAHHCPIYRKDGVLCLCLPIVEGSEELWLQIHIEDRDLMNEVNSLFFKSLAILLQHNLMLSEQTIIPTNETLHMTKQEFQNFVHAVSHDLKAPITAMLGFVSLILDNSESNLNEELAHYLSRIAVNATILKSMIDELLYIARLAPEGWEVLNIELLIKEVLMTLQLQLDQKGITYTIHKDLLRVRGNKNHFLKMFHAVIKNAVQFSPEGGRIIIGSEDGEIYVKDEGCGIAKRDIDRVFQIFFTTCTKDPSHIGTGLYIAKKIAELYKGSIRVTSTPGKGTTVFFSFPSINYQTNQR